MIPFEDERFSNMMHIPVIVWRFSVVYLVDGYPFYLYQRGVEDKLAG